MDQRPSIYLAGPMIGLTWEECLGWREHVEVELGRDWKIISPARPQKDVDRSKMIKLQTRKDNKLHLVDTATGVVASDTFFIKQSDWILANLTNAPKPSIGTMWELGYAYALQKNIIVVMDDNNVHNHPFTRRGVDLFCPTLDEAIEYFKRIKP